MSHSDVISAELPHVPVLLDEVISYLSPQNDRIYLDGTFGAGGYSKAILNHAQCRLWAIDRDPEAAVRAEKVKEKFPERFEFCQGLFGQMKPIMDGRGVTKLDGVVLDIGVSSPQLDNPEKGFSFQKDGPLDMRMGSTDITAADVVNTLPEAELANIIWKYGEERFSRKVAKAIVMRRKEALFERTADLADVVRSVVPRHKDGIDPATRTFQGLRIHVNDELGELERGLEAAVEMLAVGGRLVVVTFHSLEDRILKHFINDKTGSNPGYSRHMPQSMLDVQPTYFKKMTRKAIHPSEGEVKKNPRARSAKLRAIERIGCEG